jgi:vacuolar-type H+-ATPase subunit C/Vma6
MDFDNLEEELMKVGLTDEENQQLDKCFEERKRTGAFKPMPWSVDRKFQRALKNYMMRERDGEEFMRQFGKWYR